MSPVFRVTVLCFVIALRPFSSAGQENGSVSTIDTAREVIAAGNLSEAEAILRTLIAKRSTSSEAYNLLGEIKVKQQRLSEAEDLFQKSIAVSPNSKAYENIVLLDALAGSGIASKTAALKLLQLEPNNYNGRLVLALAYLNEANFGEALKVLQPLRHDPDPLLQALYAVALDHTGEHAAAIRIRKDLAGRDVSLQDALLSARLFRTPELKEMAEQWLAQASNLSTGQAVVQIADAYRSDGDWEEAAKFYRRALVDSPQSLQLMLSLANVEEQSGHHAEAAQYLQNAKAAVQSADDWRAYAVACMQLHLMREAVDALKSALVQPNADPDIYFLLGVIQLYFGRYNEAYECYKIALQQHPDDGRLHLALGYLWVETNDFEKAIPELKIAQQNARLAGLAHYYLALIEKAKGATAAELRELQQAIALRPDDPMILVDLAEVQISSGNLASARRNLEKALRLDDRNAKAHFQNARLLNKMGQSEGAKAELAASQSMQKSEHERSTTQLAEVK